MDANAAGRNGQSPLVENGGGFFPLSAGTGQDPTSGLPALFVQSFARTSPDADPDLARFNFSRQAPDNPNLSNVAQDRFNPGKRTRDPDDAPGSSHGLKQSRTDSPAGTQYNMAPIGEDGPLPQRQGVSYLETPAEEHPATNIPQYQEPEPNFDGRSLFAPLAVGLGSEVVIKMTPEEVKKAEKLQAHLEKVITRAGGSEIKSTTSRTQSEVVSNRRNIERDLQGSLEVVALDRLTSASISFEIAACERNGKVVFEEIKNIKDKSRILSYIDPSSQTMVFKDEESYQKVVNAIRNGDIIAGKGISKEQFDAL